MYVPHTSRLITTMPIRFGQIFREKGFDFRACCSKTVPVDPVEWKLMKNGTECGSYATVPASRYPLLNYRGEVPLESTFAGIQMLNLKALLCLMIKGRASNELRAWRKTLLGSVAMMAARTKRRTDAKTLLGSATMNAARTERSIDVNLMKMESDGGDYSNENGIKNDVNLIMPSRW